VTVASRVDGTISLDGVCPVGDAEPLLRLLTGKPDAIVDWRRCEEAHAAVIQILLAVLPKLIGPPANMFLQRHVEPILRGARPFHGQASVQE
jgi:hypothetical protein